MRMLPVIGDEYLNKLGQNFRNKLKKLARPLFTDGIGDIMDKGNLWIVPGFTLMAFAVLWTTKLSKLALAEATCRGASTYDLSCTDLEKDAIRHCQSAKRFYVGVNEPFFYDEDWRLARQWVLWFWAPIVFVMYVLTRPRKNSGINFVNILNASQVVTVDNDGVTEVDNDRLYERLPVISDNFRCAYSSHAFAAFIVFEVVLVLAPFFLLVFMLPLMIGSAYRSWGIDVLRAWWEGKEWKGVPIPSFLGHQYHYQNHSIEIPLIPRITYCDYHFVTLGHDHVLIYRCYLDANWHERTALFTWYAFCPLSYPNFRLLLAFLTFINLCNLIVWVHWASKMHFKSHRKYWVLKKWLNGDDFEPNEWDAVEKFAKSFKMGNLLMFYYIEAHTDRVVASAFCHALFRRRVEQAQHSRTSFVVNMPKGPGKPYASNIGWDLQMEPGPSGSPAGLNPYAEAPGQSPEAQRYSATSTTNLLDDPNRPYIAESPSSFQTPTETPHETSAEFSTPRPNIPSAPGFNYKKNIAQGAPELVPLRPGKIRESKRLLKRKKGDIDEEGDGKRRGRSTGRYKCVLM